MSVIIFGHNCSAGSQCRAHAVDGRCAHMAGASVAVQTNSEHGRPRPAVPPKITHAQAHNYEYSKHTKYTIDNETCFTHVRLVTPRILMRNTCTRRVSTPSHTQTQAHNPNGWISVRLLVNQHYDPTTSTCAAIVTDWARSHAMRTANTATPHSKTTAPATEPPPPRQRTVTTAPRVCTISGCARTHAEKVIFRYDMRRRR